MKKIISTQGLKYGEFKDDAMATIVQDRINNCLEHSLLMEFGEEYHTSFNFSYNVMGGEITQVVLDYTIDNPTPERLELFKDHCTNFFELHEFIIDDNDPKAPHVYFFACDIFDMACLIHAFHSMNVSLDNIMSPVDSSLTEKDAIYNIYGDRIIQIPDVPRYRVREGTMFISPGAFLNCKRLRSLELPCSIIEYKDALHEYDAPLRYKVWKTHYDGSPNEEDEVDDDDDEEFYIDEHGVGYTKDRKKLMFARHTFSEVCYVVPDGVEEINSFAFLSCNHYIELSLPRSVKVIGDSLFGSASGYIVIRE